MTGYPSTQRLSDNAPPVSRDPIAPTSPMHLPVTVSPELASSAAGFAISRGWLPDTVFAFAWAFTLDRLLGESEVALNDIACGNGPSVGVATSLHELSRDAACLISLGQFDKRRRAALAAPHEPQGDAGVDHAWWAGEAPSTEHTAASRSLLLGFDGARSELVATFPRTMFEAPFVQTILECVLRVSAAVVESPGLTLGRVDVLGAEQRTQLANWNPIPTADDRGWTIDAIFRRCAARRGAATALAGAQGRMSYAQLDRLSDGIARRLRAAGASQGSVIGVALERSFESIAVLLGILKAGAAYLPLDLKYPQERIAFVVEDAGALRIVARAQDRHHIPGGCELLEVEALCTDAAGPHSAR